jgi:hypothetical protein
MFYAILLEMVLSGSKSSRAFGSQNKAVMESSRVAENTLWEMVLLFMMGRSLGAAYIFDVSKARG